jgi:hypothetical protein
MPELTSDQQLIKAKIVAAAKSKAAQLGIKDVSGFVNAMLAVAWGESSWSSGVASGDGGVSHGIYQIGVNHGPVSHSADALRNPDININYAADYLGRVFKRHEDAGETDWRNQVYAMWGPEGQVSAINDSGPEGDSVRTNVANSISYIDSGGGLQPGAEVKPGTSPWLGPKFQQAAPTVTGGDTGPPKREDFIGPTGYFDSAGYSDATIAYYQAKTAEENYKALIAGEDEASLGEYFSAIIPLMQAKIAAGELDASKASVELQKRLDALTQGNDLYQKLLGTSLAPGQEYIPGRGPGGLYEKMGLTSEKARTVQVNPMAAALMIMGKTPEMGATPDTSYEAALAMARELQAASGQPAAAPVSVAPMAPSTFTAALTQPAAVAPPAPYTGGSADVRAGVALQPSVRQNRIPPVGPAVPPNYEAPKQIVSRYPPEMANMGDWWYNTSGQKFVWRADGWKLASATGY